MTDSPAGSLETPADAGRGSAGEVKLWLDALQLADKDEEQWRKTAADARDRYRDEKERMGNKARRFNILYANTETYVPAVYNNTPVPDVRRRFRDNDPVGKVGAQLIERALSYTVDAYDFDVVLSSNVHDNGLVGRGVARVRYEPLLKDETVVWQSTYCEHVQWDRFRHGPGRTYDEWPWVAYMHHMTREQVTKLAGERIGGAINLSWVQEGADKIGQGAPPSDTFKRVPVWEIWDKSTREVIFVSEAWKTAPLKKEPDPLKLSGFFPTPRPIYYVEDAASSVPIVPYSQYRDQAEELDRVTRRITALVNVLRWRGVADGSLSGPLAALANADDGALIPADEITALVGDKGLENAIWLMPIDKLIAVIQGLYEQREAIKQVIYEITGIADIMRGQSKASETLGAQRIKAEWGSLRVRRHQREAQRLCRDLFRMMSEIIAEHFTPETLAIMTGVKLPSAEVKQLVQQAKQQAMQLGQEPQLPQALLTLATYPTWDEVMQVLQSDGLRSFRIDVETDSTVQIELGVAQENAGAFMQGFAQFGQAFGPAVQSGIMPIDSATDILASFARMFKLGRQAEDAIERMVGDRDSLGLGETPKQEQKPDPAAMQAQADAELKREELGIRKQEVSTKAQIDMANAEIARLKAEADAQAKQAELALRSREMDIRERHDTGRLLLDAAAKDAEGERADRQMQVDGIIRASDAEMKGADMTERRQMERETGARNADMDERRFGEERKARMAEQGRAEDDDGEEVNLAKLMSGLSKTLEKLSATADEQLALSKKSRADAERLMKGM